MGEMPPAPVIENDPTEIADGVFVIPDGRVPLVPNVGHRRRGPRRRSWSTPVWGRGTGGPFDDTPSGSPTDSQLFLTLTHFHPEHGYGAQAFVGEAVRSTTARSSTSCGRRAPRTSSSSRRSASRSLSSSRMWNWSSPRSCTRRGRARPRRPPRAASGLGARAHTRRPDGVPARGTVLFTGDLVESRCFAIFPWFRPTTSTSTATAGSRCSRSSSGSTRGRRPRARGGRRR